MATTTKPKTHLRSRKPSKKRASLPNTAAQDIVGRAMLIRVVITTWQACKLDKQVTNKALSDHKAIAGAGRFRKELFGRRIPELAEVWNSSQAVRTALRLHTLPWSEAEEGWRLLPTNNYLQALEAVRTSLRRFDAAVTAFVKRYPALKAAAAEALGSMYSESDYPPTYAVESRYTHRLEFTPIPMGDDFRVSLPEGELEAAKVAVQERVLEATKAAMQDAWSRLADVVGALSKRLEDDGKHLRDTMVARITETAEALGRMNVTNDPALEEMRGRVLRELTTATVPVLKENTTKRIEVAKAAKDILDKMSAYYTPVEKEEATK